MLSIMLVVFVTAALFALYMENQSERSRVQRGEQIGHALGTLGAGLDLYIATHYANLGQSNPSVTGVVHALQPTAQELIDLLKIKGAPSVRPMGETASYRFKIYFPAACTPSRKISDVMCRPLGIAYIDKPVMRGAKVDYVALGRAVRVMQGRGGYSRPENVSQFTFPDSVTGGARIPVANPTNQAGVLAWRSDVLLANHDGLKTSGTNSMRAALRLDGNGIPHDLLGAHDISASGRLSSESIAVSGNESVGGNSEIVGNGAVKGNRTVQGWLQVLGSGLWTTDLHASGNADIRGTLSNGHDALINGTTQTDNLAFLNRHNVGDACPYQYSIGMSVDGYTLYCGSTLRWNYFQTKKGSEPFDFAKHTFIERRHTGSSWAGTWFVLGAYLYCRPENRHVTNATAWFDTLVRKWKGWGRFDMGWIEYTCFVKM